MRVRWLWWRRRALVCREAVALMGDYLDGTLASADARRLEAHLAECPHCSEHLAQLRVTIEVTGRASAEALSADALDDLVDLYRRWLSD